MYKEHISIGPVIESLFPNYSVHTPTDSRSYQHVQFNSTFTIFQSQASQYLIMQTDYQLGLLQLNQRTSRSLKRQSNPIPASKIKSPIHSTVLTTRSYRPLKQTLLTMHERFLQKDNLPSDEVLQISKRIASLSRKHRLFQSRSEWCRLQNLRYLIKLLCSRIKQKLRNEAQICESSTESLSFDIYDPIDPIEVSDSDLESELNHSDYSKSMHEPED